MTPPTLNPEPSMSEMKTGDVERVLSEARAQNPYAEDTDEAVIWNEGFCDAWATIRALSENGKDEG